jgi:hypothetical protein
VNVHIKIFSNRILPHHTTIDFKKGNIIFTNSSSIRTISVRNVILMIKAIDSLISRIIVEFKIFDKTKSMTVLPSTGSTLDFIFRYPTTRPLSSNQSSLLTNLKIKHLKNILRHRPIHISVLGKIASKTVRHLRYQK